MIRLYRDRDLRPALVAAAAEAYRPIRWDVMKQRYLTLVAGYSHAPEPVTALDTPFVH
jgi:hypothetical protein